MSLDCAHEFKPFYCVKCGKRKSIAGMVFVLLETVDIEPLSVRTFRDYDADEAHKTFERICAEHNLLEDTDLTNECEGTIRFAGDDSYAVQLIETAPE